MTSRTACSVFGQSCSPSSTQLMSFKPSNVEEEACELSLLETALPVCTDLEIAPIYTHIYDLCNYVSRFYCNMFDI